MANFPKCGLFAPGSEPKKSKVYAMNKNGWLVTRKIDGIAYVDIPQTERRIEEKANRAARLLAKKTRTPL